MYNYYNYCNYVHTYTYCTRSMGITAFPDIDTAAIIREFSSTLYRDYYDGFVL